MIKQSISKIAITADIHLSKNEKHSERYNALLKLLNYLVSNNINHLIIAGDLFDKGETNYKEFENICKQKEYQSIFFYIIPGNHDLNLTSKLFTSKNIKIIDKPQALLLEDNDFHFLFLPYREKITMGEEIVKYLSDVKDKKWALVGHGDYIEGQRIPNPHEEGVYMPLTRSDIYKFNPSFVFLGHIHKPINIENFYYPGSPHPLHRNETGLRRFLVFDTVKEKVESINIDSDVIYYNEKLILLPFLGVAQTENYIKEYTNNILSSYNLKEEEQKKIKLTIDVFGYIKEDKKAIEEVIKTLLEKKINKADINMQEVGVVQDVEEKSEVAHEALKKIENIEGDNKVSSVLKETITKHILEIIYSK